MNWFWFFIAYCVAAMFMLLSAWFTRNDKGTSTTCIFISVIPCLNVAVGVLFIVGYVASVIGIFMHAMTETIYEKWFKK